MLSYKMAVKTTGRREQKQKPEKPGCVQRTGILWKKKVKKAKATPGLPMWSPTIVLTGLDRA